MRPICATCETRLARHRLAAPRSVCLDEQGVALLLTFLMMLVLAGLALAVGVFSQNSLVTGKSQLVDKQAFYIAEAGLQRGRQAFAAGTWTAGSTNTGTFGAGEYQVTISASSPYTMTAEGYVPNQTTPVAQRRAIASGITTSTNLSLNPNVAASASSSNGNNIPGRAKDGDTGTFWEANTNGANSWLAMDFQTSTTLNQIIVRERRDITSLTIEYSDDSSSWTTVSGLSITISGTGDSEVYTATFTATSHRYFRSFFTGVTSNKKAAVREMECDETVNNPVSLSRGTFTTQW